MFNFQEYPFFRLILPFIAGIIWGSYMSDSSITIIHLTNLGALGFGVVALTLNSGRPAFFTITLTAFLFWAGDILFRLHDPRLDEKHITSTKHKEYIIGLIGTDPMTKNTTQFIMEVKGVIRDSQYVRSKGKVMVYLKKNNWENDLKQGYLISLSTWVNELSDNTNPYSFDYSKYLRRKKIYFNAYADPSDLVILKREHSGPIQAFSIGFRSWVFDSFRSTGLDDIKISILLAMLIGDRKMVSDELHDRFSDTGSLHLLAVSGLHVGIIILMFNFLFKWFGAWLSIPDIVHYILLLALIWIYACITGFSSSVMRASFMATVYLISRVFDRTLNIYNLIFFTAICLLFIDPYLIQDAGFQFSFLALLGIVYFHKRIYNLIALNNPFLDRIWNLVVVSIAAQALILPFSLFYFQKFSLYFWLSGVILVPYTGLIIVLGFFTLFTAKLIPVTMETTTKILELVLSSFELILTWIQSLPGCAIRDAFVSSTELWLLNSFVLLGIILSRIKIRYIVVWGFVTCILWNGYQLCLAQVQARQAKITVYDVSKGGIIDVFIGKNCFEIVHTVKEDHKNFVVKGNRQYAGIENVIPLSMDQYLNLSEFHVDNGLLLREMHSIFFLNKTIRSIPKGPISFLIISQNYEGDLARVLEIMKPQEIILDRSNHFSYVKRCIEIAKTKGIPVWNIATQGSKTINL